MVKSRWAPVSVLVQESPVILHVVRTFPLQNVHWPPGSPLVAIRKLATVRGTKDSWKSRYSH